MLDSRPDLAADSDLWESLLQRAYVADGHDANGIYGVLDAFRAQGAALVPQAVGVKIEPGAIGDADYKEWREQWLRPRRDALVALLSEVRDANQGLYARS